MEVSGPPAEPEPERAGPAAPQAIPAWWTGLGARLRTPGSFARSVLTLMTGTTIANLIPIAAAPVLTRLYSPADFGMFAIFSAVSALIAVASTGRYEMAIVLPPEDSDAFELLGLSMVLATVVAALCAIVVVIFHPALLRALHAPALSAWTWALPAGVLLMAAVQGLGNWLNRKRDYRRIANGRIAQAVSTAFFAIVLARAGLGPGGLILGALAGQALATVLLGLGAWQGLRGSGLKISQQGMRREAIRHREFPRINVAHSLIDNLNASATLVVLSHSFGAVVVGQYSMVMRVLTAPVTLIGSAISQVFYQRAAAEHQRSGDLRPLVRALLSRSLWIAAPCALVLLLGAPTLFRFVFGPAWAPAGHYARLLAPYTFFYFLAAPLAFLPFVVRRQWQSFLLSTVGNLLFLGCIALGKGLGSPELGFGLLSVVMSLYFGYYIAWMTKIAEPAPANPA